MGRERLHTAQRDTHTNKGALGTGEGARPGRVRKASQKRGIWTMSQRGIGSWLEEKGRTGGAQNEVLKGQVCPRSSSVWRKLGFPEWGACGPCVFCWEGRVVIYC